jgi:UDP-N-acetylmuramoyl-tripeptide--D-alanyl-D-alanine ligase
VHGQIKETEPALGIEWSGILSEDQTYRIRTHLAGAYNFENIMAAICVASYLGVDSAKINRSIADYVPQNNRSQYLNTKTNRLIMDAYNANPSSMEVALDNFLSQNVSPKMVILGEMRELGKYSDEEHQKIVDRLRQSDIERVILCGENFRACHAIDLGWHVFSQTPELMDFLREEKISGYNILIKGSRANQLEKIIEFL